MSTNSKTKDKPTEGGRDFQNKAHYESGNDERGTPVELARQLKRANGGRFDLDPCSGCEPEPIGEERFTIEDDGLAQRWFGAVWMNPPYSDIEDWMKKASTEAQRDDVDYVLCLVPNRTSTQWFHKYAVEAEVFCVIEGRLKFEHTDGSAPFPSAIFAYGDVPDDVMDVLHHRGAVYHIEEGDDGQQVRLMEWAEDDVEEPEEDNSIVVSQSECQPLKSVNLHDRLTLHINDKTLGAPDHLDAVVTVEILAGQVRNGQQELLTQVPQDDRDGTWYMLSYPVFGDGSVYAAVEEPGSGWYDVILEKVEINE